MRQAIFLAVLVISAAISGVAWGKQHSIGQQVELIGGGLAWHIGAEHDRHSDLDRDLPTWALGLAYGPWEGVIYENSFDDTSVFAGYHHRWKVSDTSKDRVYLGLRAGVASGYDYAEAELVPVLQLTATFYVGRLGLEVGLLPTGLWDPGEKRSDAVITYALRWKL